MKNKYIKYEELEQIEDENVLVSKVLINRSLTELIWKKVDLEKQGEN